MNTLEKKYRKFENYLAAWDLRAAMKWMLFLGVVCALAAAYLGYTRLYMTNERRFWTAVENSMATPSVTRTIKNGGSGNEVVQDQQFFFAPQKVSRSHVSFMQKSATVDTHVETEGIAFIGEQYSRYTKFDSDQKRSDGTTPSLEGLLGKWEKTASDPAQLDLANESYIAEMVTLGIFGNFDSGFRKNAVAKLKNEIYTVDPSSITEDNFNNRRVLSVSLTVKLKKYATLLQESFRLSGYGEFSPLNPDNYQEDSDISANFLVDPARSAIVAIRFGNREEIYSGYGIQKTVERPVHDYESGQLEAAVRTEIGDSL